MFKEADDDGVATDVCFCEEMHLEEVQTWILFELAECARGLSSSPKSVLPLNLGFLTMILHQKRHWYSSTAVLWCLEVSQPATATTTTTIISCKMPAAAATASSPPPIAKTASAAEDTASHSKSNSRNRMRNLFRRNKSQPDKPSAAVLLEKALEEAKHSPVKQQRQQQQRLSTPIKVNSTSTPTQKAVASQSNDDDEKKDLHKSFLCRTKFFKEMIQSSFELVDQDGSGTIDEKELYSGLLLIHLKLGTYAGPAACKPISREKCHAVFMKMDTDNSGHLDRDEFEDVMMVLFGNVMMRVAIQYACTLLVVPMIAQQLLNGILWVIGYVTHVITTLDEHNSLANTVELTLEHVWQTAVDFWSPLIPAVVVQGTDKVQELISAVPESVWNTIPLTLLSTILSLMLIPWSLLKIDDFFQWLAERKQKKPTTHKKKTV